MPGRRHLLVIAATVSLLALPAAADATIVVNGDFETGSLAGWQTETSQPQSGTWYPYAGTSAPQTGLPVAAPPQGKFAATSDQDDVGRFVLYQDIALPAGATQATLSLLAYYQPGGAMSAPDSLQPSPPNQQYRIDVMRPSAPITSVAPTDILVNVFRTLTGDLGTRPPTLRTADLTPFAGQTVRLRFAQVGTQSNMRASTDAVSIVSNALTLGQPKLNKKKGTAEVPVTVPDAGELTLTGKRVVKQLSAPASASVQVGAGGTVNLRVKAKGKAKRKLNSRGKAKVRVTIAYTPNGGSVNTRTAKVKLKKKL